MRFTREYQLRSNGDARVVIGDNSTIVANGGSAHAVYANKGGIIELGSTNIRAEGTTAHGIYAEAGSKRSVVQQLLRAVRYISAVIPPLMWSVTAGNLPCMPKGRIHRYPLLIACPVTASAVYSPLTAI